MKIKRPCPYGCGEVLEGRSGPAIADAILGHLCIDELEQQP